MRGYSLFLLLLALGLLTVPIGCPAGDDDDSGHSDDDDGHGDDDDDAADDDDSGGPGDDDDSSKDKWLGPVPEGALVGEVLLFIESEHGDDDDAGHDDDDDDSAGDQVDGEPVVGLTVTELGTNNTADTDTMGQFVILPEDYEPARVGFQVQGDVPRILLVTLDAYRAVSRVVELAASQEEHEDDLYPELYGGARDATLGTVDVVFIGPEEGGLAGAQAELDGSTLGGRVFTNGDDTAAGTTLLAGNEQIVLFGNVTPGEQPLTVTAPAGWSCFAPAAVTVEPDTITLVQVGCRL